MLEPRVGMKIRFLGLGVWEYAEVVRVRKYPDGDLVDLVYEAGTKESAVPWYFFERADEVCPCCDRIPCECVW